MMKNTSNYSFYGEWYEEELLSFGFKVHTRYDRNSFITYEFKLLAEQTL